MIPTERCASETARFATSVEDAVWRATSATELASCSAAAAACATLEEAALAAFPAISDSEPTLPAVSPSPLAA